MDEKLKSAINKIVILSKQDEEFNRELRKALNLTFSANVVSESSSVQKDVKAIREALDIRANYSISYDFIRQQRLRDQLTIDNLRMENAALKLTEKEQYRFYVFCVNAFYQIENIINYYYFTAYPDIGDLQHAIETGTSQEAEKYQYHKSNDVKTVADITISHKLNAFCNTFFQNDRIKIDYSNLRRVRNEGEHRCMIIIDDKDETNSLYKFLKFNTFNSVRILLKKLVNIVKQEVENNAQIKATTAEITNLLPSACFIKYDNKTAQLPTKLLCKIRNKCTGDKVILSIKGNTIIDVE